MPPKRLIQDVLHFEAPSPCPICYERLAGKPQMTTECKHTFHTDCIDTWAGPKWGQDGILKCPICRNVMRFDFSGPKEPNWKELTKAIFEGAGDTQEAFRSSTRVTFEGPSNWARWADDRKNWIGWVKLENDRLWDYPAKELHILNPENAYAHVLFHDAGSNFSLQNVKDVWDAVAGLDRFSLWRTGGRWQEADFFWFPGHKFQPLNLNAYQPSEMSMRVLQNISLETLRSSMAGELLDKPFLIDLGYSIDRITRMLRRLSPFTITWTNQSSKIRLPIHSENVRLIKYYDWIQNEVKYDADTVFDMPETESDEDMDLDDEAEDEADGDEGLHED